MVFLPLVTNPGHRFRVRSHVGRRDVLVRSNDFVNLVDELASNSFLFLAAEFPRVDADTAFGSTIGNIHDSGLPGHQRSQRADFVQIDLPVITQTALHGSTGVTVLDPESDQHF